jgi:hypothetical protein
MVQRPVHACGWRAQQIQDSSVKRKGSEAGLKHCGRVLLDRRCQNTEKVKEAK